MERRVWETDGRKMACSLESRGDSGRTPGRIKQVRLSAQLIIGWIILSRGSSSAALPIAFYAPDLHARVLGLGSVQVEGNAVELDAQLASRSAEVPVSVWAGG